MRGVKKGMSQSVAYLFISEQGLLTVVCSLLTIIASLQNVDRKR